MNLAAEKSTGYIVGSSFRIYVVFHCVHPPSFIFQHGSADKGSIPRKHQVFQKVIAYLGVTIGELMKQGGENDDTQENNKRKCTDS